ncbi:MAG: undecaprenyl-diphosphate phosphatase [Bacteroidales bacterium]|nr:undecaprenyl-diphosphate phosphatase [Bacteroidales bacterium]MBR5211864.1 undecaprenyl-diphosphate phosphatase [Bacteroidales bacterium]
MEWFEAVLLGLIQGLTEFLPVSSSGHLEIGKVLLGVETTEDLLFTTMVHAATVLSTIIVFRKQIWDLLKGFFCGIKDWKITENEAGKKVFVCNDQTDYLFKIALSMIPIMVVGLFFKDSVEALFGSIQVVGFALIVTALLLFFSDYASRPGRRSIFPANEYRNGISYWQAFAIGLGQSFAVVPGLSRSGTTISTGLICGVRRESMAQFSFLMVLVPILGETFLEIVGGEFGASSVGALPLILGFVSAFLSGLFACKAMVALVKKAKLSWFALYCLVAAACIFIFA